MAAPRSRKRDWGADRVLCVSPHAASGGHQIAYVKGGRRRTEQRASEKAANERAAKLQIALAGPHESSGGSAAKAAGRATKATAAATGWADLLWKLTQQMVKDPGNDDLQRVVRSASSAASAAAKHLDEEALTRRIAALEAEQAKIVATAAAGQSDAERQVEEGQAGEAGAVYQ